MLQMTNPNATLQDAEDFKLKQNKSEEELNAYTRCMSLCRIELLRIVLNILLSGLPVIHVYCVGGGMGLLRECVYM